MNDFQGYEKMPDSIRKLGLDLADTKLLETVEWVVTEKIHGANFSFIFADDTLKYAKRKDYLRWADDFFGFQIVAERLDDKIMRLFERIRKDHDFGTATVFGELFGGEYPHPSVAADPRMKPIQTGIWYSPTVEFAAFDIVIEAVDGSRKYLDYAEAVTYFEECGIPYAKPLLIGKLNQALFFDTRFDSKVPTQLGLPELRPNLVEGVVVKPFRNIVVKTAKGSMRPIFKLKNKEFAEEQFHESQAWSYQHDGVSTSERMLFLVPELRCYLTSNRLQSTISKIGGLSVGNTARLQQVKTAFVADAFESFWEDNPELAGEFSEADLDWLTERVAAEAERAWKQFRF